MTLNEQFKKWETDPPADLFGDPIWRLPAFRIAHFMAAVARDDVLSLIRDGAPYGKISQLDRSVPSIVANIAEGYSKYSGKERARYFEIALGSAREAREWYRDVQTWLGAPAAQERGMLLTRIVKILSVAIPRERAGESEKRIQSARSVPAPAPAPAPATSTSTSNPQPATSKSIPDSSSSPSQTDQ